MDNRVRTHIGTGAPKFKYVPCLRWKQGEYQAVCSLSRSAQESTIPLIEVPEIGWDFETGEEAKTIDDHLAKFARQVRTKWGTRRCFVDLNLIDPSARMADDAHPLDFIFAGLRSYTCVAVPVTGLDRDSAYQRTASLAASRDGYGICFRLGIEQAAKGDVKTLVNALLASLKAKIGTTDLVLDLGAPNFNPLDGFAKVVLGVIARLPRLDGWRSFSMIGTSFPSTMGAIKGSMEFVPRYEWTLYRKVIAGLREKNVRLPDFGDYAISHPAVLQMDMRFVKPSASIRYTVDDGWCIIKKPNVRATGYAQFRDHCRTLIGSQYYLGAAFSAGDRYIESCARGVASHGNLTTWRRVGTNHHIEKAVRDIASFYASLSRK